MSTVFPATICLHTNIGKNHTYESECIVYYARIPKKLKAE